MTLETLISNMTAIFTAQMSWVGTLMTTISNNPILLFAVVGAFALVAVGIVRRLLAL